MKSFMKFLAVSMVLAFTGIALGSVITTVYVKTASTTVPTSASDGTPLNIANVSENPVTKVKISLVGAGDIVSGRINIYRFVKDAGWTREPGLDMVIPDGGYPGGAGTNGMGLTFPDITINTNGNSARIDATAVSILQGDGGTAVPTLYIQTATH